MDEGKKQGEEEEKGRAESPGDPVTQSTTGHLMITLALELVSRLLSKSCH